MLAQFKMYFIIGAILAAAIGSWSARGWYEDGKIVDALKTQKEEHEKQAVIDAEALRVALGNESSLRLKYRSLKNEASKVTICSNGGVDFLRVFNRSAVAANAKK